MPTDAVWFRQNAKHIFLSHTLTLWETYFAQFSPHKSSEMLINRPGLLGNGPHHSRLRYPSALFSYTKSGENSHAAGKFELVSHSEEIPALLLLLRKWFALCWPIVLSTGVLPTCRCNLIWQLKIRNLHWNCQGPIGRNSAKLKVNPENRFYIQIMKMTSAARPRGKVESGEWNVECKNYSTRAWLKIIGK